METLKIFLIIYAAFICMGGRIPVLNFFEGVSCERHITLDGKLVMFRENICYTAPSNYTNFGGTNYIICEYLSGYKNHIIQYLVLVRSEK